MLCKRLNTHSPSIIHQNAYTCAMNTQMPGRTNLYAQREAYHIRLNNKLWMSNKHLSTPHLSNAATSITGMRLEDDLWLATELRALRQFCTAISILIEPCHRQPATAFWIFADLKTGKAFRPAIAIMQSVSTIFRVNRLSTHDSPSKMFAWRNYAGHGSD